MLLLGFNYCLEYHTLVPIGCQDFICTVDTTKRGRKGEDACFLVIFLGIEYHTLVPIGCRDVYMDSRDNEVGGLSVAYLRHVH